MGPMIEEQRIQSGSDVDLSKRTLASCALSEPSLVGLGGEEALGGVGPDGNLQDGDLQNGDLQLSVH
jgi:hypothetical protein